MENEMLTDVNIAPIWSWDRHFWSESSKDGVRRVGSDLTPSPYVWREGINNEDTFLGFKI